MFNDEEQYTVLQNTIWKYKEIIKNFEKSDVKLKSFSEQQKIVSDVIHLTNFITFDCYFDIFLIVYDKN